MVPSKKHAALIDMAASLDQNEPLDCLVNWRDVKHIIALRLDQRRSPEEMIRRIRHEEFAAQLLQLLATHYRQTPGWIPFVDAVLTCDEGWFTELIDPLTIHSVFQDAETLKHIVSHHYDLIQQQHPWTTVLPWDTYWSASIRHFIQARGYRHAFCELRKARNGFFVGDPTQCEEAGNCFQEVMYSAANRLHAVSKTVLAQVTRELHAAMVQDGQLSADPPTIWTTGRRCAGMWTAYPFLKRTTPASDGKTNYQYDAPGAMILNMADVFRRRPTPTRAEPQPA